ncbi:TPR repeat profile [Nakaseomyces glabratus]|nr:TPR repeat profile [Nakaseomyces glabratus]KAH7609789.1 TPR repeat profile [Nakaseomyces glabratus]KAH7615497.1 TPR repeat profile [Nakaseomyces glabratus]
MIRSESDPEDSVSNGDMHEEVDMSPDEEGQFYENIEGLRNIIDYDHDRDGAYRINDGEVYDGSKEGDDSLLAIFTDVEDFEEDEEDEEDNFMDAIREANNFKVKRKKNNKSNNKKSSKKRPMARVKAINDPEVAQLISQANEAFVKQDLPEAERLFNEVIKKDPRNFAAYETLGDIYQLQGRMNDCCNSWFLAAHLNASDWEFWKIVAILSSDLGHIRQAIYCFSRVIHLNKEEWECIYRRALLYKQTGQIARALDGFQKMYTKSPSDANILRELAILYVDYNKVEKAIELYLESFEKNIKRRQAIIRASEAVFESSDDDDDDDPNSKNSDEDQGDEDDYDIQNPEELNMYPTVDFKKINKKYNCVFFEWSSLNILAELCLKSNQKKLDSISLIKRCARWIQHREGQTFWDDVHDDSEFDDRRAKNGRYDALPESEKTKSYSMPIDIRIRLGLLHLRNENVMEALNHFQFLYDEPFSDVSDLYFEVGLALTKSEKYKEAIDFFTPLLSIPEWCTIELYEPLTKCYKEIEDYEKAKEYGDKVLEMDPKSMDAKLNVAEINYYLGDKTTFRQLLVDVIEERKRQAESIYDQGPTKKPRIEEFVSETEPEPEPEHESEHEQRVDKDTSEKPLLEDSKYRVFNTKKKRTPLDAERERLDREKKMRSKVIKKYEKVHEYKEGMLMGSDQDTKKWIDIVSELIDIFSSVKNFFAKSRSKKFVGIIKRTKKFTTPIDYKVEQLSKLVEGESFVNDLPVLEERVILSSTTELRGLTYDQWFELFMELSLVITKHQSVEDGLSVIDTAQEVNVFFQDPIRAKIMRFVKLGILLENKDESELTESLRGLLNQFQFNRKVLQVFMYSLAHGQDALNILSSTVQQKFFLRQLKAFDSIRYDTHVTGQASLTNKEVENPERKPSPYLYYIYAVLLYSSRGFLSALQYLSFLEKDMPDDPMVNLMMGLAHMHRSMQRLTANRHFQLMHGLRYLKKYYSIRQSMYTRIERQEADYNMGRAYHMIGLVSKAIEYYKKVLDSYEDSALKKHAAYNSMLIYQESGNLELANSIMEKYLSV